jgi:hypothetical protein
VDVSDNARGLEIVEAATIARTVTHKAASDDHRSLAGAYRELPTSAVGNYLKRAQEVLTDSVNIFDSARESTLPAGERARFRNLFLNARDKASFGLETLQSLQETQNQLGELSPFQGFLKSAAGAGSATGKAVEIKELSDIFGPMMGSSIASSSSTGFLPLSRRRPSPTSSSSSAQTSSCLTGEKDRSRFSTTATSWANPIAPPWPAACCPPIFARADTRPWTFGLFGISNAKGFGRSRQLTHTSGLNRSSS